MASHTDALNAATTFSYDARDNLTAATSPTGAADSWAYADTTHPYFASTHTDTEGSATAYT